MRRKIRAAADLLGDEPTALDLIERAADSLGDDFGGDTLNGYAFAKRNVGRLLYVPEFKSWLTFDGVRWIPGNADEAMQSFAADRMEAALSAEMESSTSENRAATKAALKLLHDRSRQQSALASAAALSNIRAGVAEFDRDAMQLGVRNGVLDLSKGKLIPPSPNQRISRTAGGIFDPDATCDEWKAFLRRVLPDREVRNFVKRAAGYTLTGLVDEEVMIFMRGVGANGKSTFANVLAAIFADYEITLGCEALVKSKHDSTYERERARLPGARLALVNETAQGDVWDDAKIKQLASREKIPARKLYGEGFDFMPSHCIWIRGNHAPGAHDAGHAFWRRVVPVHFNQRIPRSEQIADLDRRIVSKESSGVLNWLVEGCLEWQRDGLQIPEVIEAERHRYRESTDIIGQWLAQRTVRVVDKRILVSEAFLDFREFCHASGASAGYINAFSQAMNERGYMHKGSRREGRNFDGLTLRSVKFRR